MSSIPGVHVEEKSLPMSGPTALAGAIWSSLQFAGAFTDLLVHEGQPIRLKSAKGLIKLDELGLPNGDLVVTADHIKQFFGTMVDGLEPGESASKHWDEVVAPLFRKQQAVNRSLKTPGEEYLRFSLFQHDRGKIAMMMRPTRPPRALEHLGINDKIFERIRNNPHGLLIVTGRPSSGKTATALSILDWLNRNTSGHIETVEDPIEYPMREEGCVYTQREVGVDVASFGEGLRDAMRHTPDAVLAGEIRDRDTAEAAILGGESGALMIVTTHGRSMVGTLRKILALTGDQAGAMRAVLAGSLIGVMRQELLPHVDGEGYSMVHDTLHATDLVRAHVERGEWTALEKLTADNQASPNFVPMRERINELVAQRKIDINMAASAMAGR
jgi:twitching motility protein PilT